MSDANHDVRTDSSDRSVTTNDGVNKSLLIPLAVFVGLVMILAVGFNLEDPHFLPSELIDQQFPEFSLNELVAPDRIVTHKDIKGQVALVNVWATWCPNCLIEHPELMRISREEGLPLYGINYNDESVKARQWLVRHNNPFQFNIVDDQGKLGIDLGVYGAPETFVLDANGVIQYRHVGPVTRRVWEETLRPVVDLLLSQASQSSSVMEG
ncbi:MAG: cytochrome c biogenesis protein CcmG/thiol:disulfide interchange protein DsbE [Candidatus Azotimanducaceae bacterium]|jgi:cytochrome c biogenesis protein CcmG/thiol:disulfide interchange protein DsbE